MTTAICTQLLETAIPTQLFSGGAFRIWPQAADATGPGFWSSPSQYAVPKYCAEPLKSREERPGFQKKRQIRLPRMRACYHSQFSFKNTRMSYSGILCFQISIQESNPKEKQAASHWQCRSFQCFSCVRDQTRPEDPPLN